MAAIARRLDSNVPGPWYVDSTCIDCGACRWIAPAVFDSHGDYSRVFAQPTDEAQAVQAGIALLACPTGSIGASPQPDLAAARAALPLPITENVWYLGYHSEDSFGAAAWVIAYPEGNVLVDSPRYTGAVAKALEELGGIRWMVLTHRDDVADHARFAERFGCERVLHVRDARGALRSLERLIEGDAAIELAAGLTLIPTPGHTQGSMCLHWNDEVLFTGDHLAWSLRQERLIAFRNACWYDWGVQTGSMEKLRDYRFNRVLPGHGAPAALDYPAMAEALEACIGWMKTV